jgi:hypothetical protein
MVIYTTLAATARAYYTRFSQFITPGQVGLYIGSSDTSHEANRLRQQAFNEFSNNNMKLVFATRMYLTYKHEW